VWKDACTQERGYVPASDLDMGKSFDEESVHRLTIFIMSGIPRVCKATQRGSPDSSLVL
jgi:hypothetical protein